MTTEEKAKAYDEALERAKNMIDDLRKGEDILAVSEIEAMFPELKVSEDERIREFLIDLLSHGTWKKDWPFSPAECVAWLEKQKKPENISASTMIPSCWELEQKEQKPAEWSEDIIQKAIKEVGLTQHQINWFKTNVFPPKQEWSEEDIKKIRSEEYTKGFNDAAFGGKLKEWSEVLDINTLRDWSMRFAPDIREVIEATAYHFYNIGSQSHWKPSEEQIYSLGAVVKGYNECTVGSVGYNLKELYNNLKKLM